MNNGRHHIIQFTCIMALLSAIVVQGFTGVVKTRPLSPFIDQLQVVKQDLNFEHYRDGSYQMYLAQNAWKKTGFREFFSRCYNQMAFAFGRTANKNIKKGSHHELYLTGNLDDITGKLLMDRYGSIENAKAEARKNVEETLALVDTLRQHGTEFLFVFCPTKTAVYPEYMPKPYKDNLADFCLADYYVELFKENGIPHIDFYNYFKTIKDTVPYPLYTQTGSHWASATLPFVSDSILRKMEALSGFSLPSIDYVSPHLTSKYSGQDGELEPHIDLLLPLCKPKVPQPVFALQDTIGKDRPHLLVVGDGYFVSFENTCFLDAFDTWNYWKYNEDIISSDAKYNWQKVKYLPEAYQMLDEADIVVAMFTSNYLFNYMCGFPKTAQDLFLKGVTSEQEALEATIQSIKGHQEWYQSIENQAKELGISTEENLRRNAIYIINSREQNTN